MRIWGRYPLRNAGQLIAENVPHKISFLLRSLSKGWVKFSFQREVLYYRQVRVNLAYLRGTSRERLARTMGHCASRRVMDTKAFQA